MKETERVICTEKMSVIDGVFESEGGLISPVASHHV